MYVKNVQPRSVLTYTSRLRIRPFRMSTSLGKILYSTMASSPTRLFQAGERVITILIVKHHISCPSSEIAGNRKAKSTEKGQTGSEESLVDMRASKNASVLDHGFQDITSSTSYISVSSA